MLQASFIAYPLYNKLKRMYLVHRVYPDPRSVNLDFVRVHGGVGDENLGVFHDFRLSDPNFFVQDEPVV